MVRRAPEVLADRPSRLLGGGWYPDRWRRIIYMEETTKEGGGCYQEYEGGGVAVVEQSSVVEWPRGTSRVVLARLQGGLARGGLHTGVDRGWNNAKE